MIFLLFNERHISNWIAHQHIAPKVLIILLQRVNKSENRALSVVVCSLLDIKMLH